MCLIKMCVFFKFEFYFLNGVTRRRHGGGGTGGWGPPLPSSPSRPSPEPAIYFIVFKELHKVRLNQSLVSSQHEQQQQ